MDKKEQLKNLKRALLQLQVLETQKFFYIIMANLKYYFKEFPNDRKAILEFSAKDMEKLGFYFDTCEIPAIDFHNNTLIDHNYLKTLCQKNNIEMHMVESIAYRLLNSQNDLEDMPTRHYFYFETKNKEL